MLFVGDISVLLAMAGVTEQQIERIEAAGLSIVRTEDVQKAMVDLERRGPEIVVLMPSNTGL